MTFIPSSSYTKEDLIACGDGNLFGPSNGRLPADEMLMFDSIDQIDKVSGKYSKGKKEPRAKDINIKNII